MNRPTLILGRLVRRLGRECYWLALIPQIVFRFVVMEIEEKGWWL